MGETDFDVWLRSKWDGDALKAAQAEFKRTGKAAQDTKGDMDSLGYSAKSLKAELMTLVAFAEVVAQFKEGFEQVSKLEQVMNQLERQAKQNGHSFDDVKGKIVGFADQLKKVAGLDDDEVIPGMVKLYTATKDVEQATTLARIAADLAIGTHKSYAEAQDIVLAVAQGNVRTLRELGLSFESTGDKSKDAEKGLAILQKTFAGSAENAKGAAVEINRMKEQWEDVRNEVVERLTPALMFAWKWLQSVFTAMDGFGAILADVFGRSLGYLYNLGTALVRLVKGDFDGAKEAAKTALSEVAGIGTASIAIAKQTADRVAAIWKGAKGEITGGEGKAKGFGAGDAGTKTGPGESRDEATWVLIGGVLYKRDDLLKATEDLYKKAKEIADREEKFKQAQLKRERKDAKDALDDQQRDREEGFRNMTRLIVEEVKLKKQAAAQEREMALATANALTGLATELFGESKAIAIAQAIINTYEGATKALAQGGIVGPVLAAIVIATGLAQVATIASTNPSTGGEGFDDQRNDAAARAGGRRWALDMIGEFSGGASEISRGWAQGMMGSSTTTHDNRRTYNVNIHGSAFMDPSNVQAAKKFQRTLDVIGTTVEGQRTIARSAR